MAHYYIKHFLPLCVDLCRPDAGAAVDEPADPTAANPAPGGGNPAPPGQGTAGSSDSNGNAGSRAPPSRDGGTGAAGGGETDAAEGLSFFPDPTREVSEHSPVARGVAYIFLKRQQVRPLEVAASVFRLRGLSRVSTGACFGARVTLLASTWPAFFFL